MADISELLSSTIDSLSVDPLKKPSLLWISDENTSTIHSAFEQHLQDNKIELTAITNRYDQFIALKKYCKKSYFHDFSTIEINKEKIKNCDNIIFNVSKERTTTHHIINIASQLLANNINKKNKCLIFYGKKMKV